jgi:glutamyl-tRNA reductase
VKEAFAVARASGTVAGQLEHLLQSAFAAAKKVRSETEIGSSSVSIASVAVEMARKIFGNLQGRTVFLVGAGKMSELAARHLVQQGAGTILVTNRTQARAERMAEAFKGKVIPYEAMYDAAVDADIVISSTGAPHPIFRKEHGQRFMQRRRNRPMFFIDIAVPRDVDPRMNEVEGCFVYDIDDLQQVAAAHLADRGRESAAAEHIVSGEVDKYQQRLESLDAVPAILALQQNAESLRQAELARAAAKLAASAASLTPAQQAAVDAMTRSLTAKLLHQQIVDLRKKSE